MSDELGDRMKEYENVEGGRRLMPLLPAIARLDGKCFSSFTRGLERPYDVRLSELMIATTRFLVEETNACVGYTQSDEITLAWLSTDYKSRIWFDGRIQKMCSVLAAMCSVYFNRTINALPETHQLKTPVFDCRLWNVPCIQEGANCFLWREIDATKNSVSMAAREFYSDRELFGKGRSDQQEMLFAKGVNWNDYPAFFKRGTYIQRRKFTRKFTTDELDNLPPKHEARANPDLMVERTDYVSLDMPKMSSVINRAQVLFFGAEPISTEAADAQA